jgi:predicted PurR-regulated permease PerM
MIGLVGARVAGDHVARGVRARTDRLGRAPACNSVAIFVSVMFWGWMWGALGMIMAVPILMIVKTIADHVESMKGISELLGDDR